MTTQTDRREHREDARFILIAFAGGKVSLDKALDLLGFGEPIEDGPQAGNEFPNGEELHK